MITDHQQLEKSLELAQGKTARLEALLDLVKVYENTDYVKGWQLADEALTIAVELSDRASEARAKEGLANCLWKLAEYAESIEYFEKALDKYLGLGDLYGVARCYCGMGIISGSMEQYRIALEYFEEGLSAARRAKRHHLAATITGNIGHVHFNYGRYKEAMECFNHSLAFYSEEGLIEGEANMLSGIAGIHVYLGEYDKGLELNRRAFELHRKVGHQKGIAIAMTNTGIVLQRKGKLEAAKKELLAALKYTRAINLKISEYDALKNLSELCSEMEQEEEAAEYLKLYLEGQREEKKISVQRKNEQFRQRQQVIELRNRQ